MFLAKGGDLHNEKIRWAVTACAPKMRIWVYSVELIRAEASSIFDVVGVDGVEKEQKSGAGPLGKAWRTSGRKKPQKTTEPVDTSLPKSALTRVWQFWART